jgi:multiple sugar transport system ATP-binding protein
MRLELPRLLRQSGATVLYVTQDYKEAMALADRIAVLAGGSFIQIATPEEIYTRPATLNVARLFGDPSINTAEAKIDSDTAGASVTLGGGKIAIDAAYRAFTGRAVTFGVRPEAVEIGGSTGIDAEVMAVTPLNERTVLLLQTPSGWEFLASLPSSSLSIPEPGARVKASFAPAGTHIFDLQSGERLNV